MNPPYFQTWINLEYIIDQIHKESNPDHLKHFNLCIHDLVTLQHKLSDTKTGFIFSELTPIYELFRLIPQTQKYIRILSLCEESDLIDE